jgi:hypothetical protein
MKNLIAFLFVAVIGLSVVADANALGRRRGCGGGGCSVGSGGCGSSSGCGIGSSGCNISSSGSGCNISRSITPDTAVPVQAAPFQLPALKADVSATGLITNPGKSKLPEPTAAELANLFVPPTSYDVPAGRSGVSLAQR